MIASLTISVALLLSADVSLTESVDSVDPAARGLEIATAARDADSGYGDYGAEATMTLTDRSGRESSRTFRSQILEQSQADANVKDLSLLTFDWPGDIAGTALLTHGRLKGEDAQWLYLPALKRVKRISASNRSGSFMGSEFSYEDFLPQQIEDFTYTWLRDEACPNRPELTCHVSERRPVDATSGYSHSVLWQDSEAYRTFQITYFDRSGNHLKTLQTTGFNQYNDQYWRPSRMDMANHLTGKGTSIDWSDYKFNVGLKESDFTKRALERQ